MGDWGGHTACVRHGQRLPYPQFMPPGLLKSRFILRDLLTARQAHKTRNGIICKHLSVRSECLWSVYFGEVRERRKITPKVKKWEGTQWSEHSSVGQKDLPPAGGDVQTMSDILALSHPSPFIPDTFGSPLTDSRVLLSWRSPGNRGTATHSSGLGIGRGSGTGAHIKPGCGL